MPLPSPASLREAGRAREGIFPSPLVGEGWGEGDYRLEDTWIKF
jgi:hypothetical protein